MVFTVLARHRRPADTIRRNEVKRLENATTPQASRLAEVVRRGDKRLLGHEARRRMRRIERARPALESLTTPLGAEYPPTVGEMAKLASTKPHKAVLLYAAASTWAPARVLELGTCCGVGSAYLLAALSPDARLVSLERSPVLASTARGFWRELGLDATAEIRVGDFAETFADAATPPPDLAFIDGNHHEEPTWAYFEALARPGALLVFDDIAWSDGMRRVWERIRADTRVAAYADLGMVGLAATH